MRSWTVGEFETKVFKELDMLEESFVDLDEFVGYLQEAISDAEAEIHRLGLGEDYFLTSAFVDMVEGENEITLPDDIYVRDIRRLMFARGSDIYPIRRFRGPNKFEAIAYARLQDSGADYRYFLENDPGDSQDKIILVPAARETASDLIQMHFIRNARQVPTTDTANEDEIRATKIDIPEFINFLIAYVKVKIKEKAMEPLDSAMLFLQTQRQLMVDTLAGFQDDDNEIIPDLSAYMESN